nr:uncharacterized protein LOC110911999 isoform X3 [Ipomoea batatas]
MELLRRLGRFTLMLIGRLFTSILIHGTSWQTCFFLNHQLVLVSHTQIQPQICLLQAIRERLKMHTYFLSSGLKDFLSTSIEIFTFLEKVMQGTMFHSYLKLSTAKTRESRIPLLILRASWLGMLLRMITMTILAHLSIGGHMA